MTDEYRKALEAAIHEYETLGEQRRGIDRRLAELSQTIATLSRLLGFSPTVPLGLTDAVRMVLRGAGVPTTPMQIRDRLSGMGFDMTRYTNQLAAVHTILKRLNDSGEARLIPRAGGKHEYAWNHGVRTVIVPDIRRTAQDNAAERAAGAAPADAVPGPRSKRRTSRNRATTRTAR